ncbi:hypothetical protein N7488_009769 [Penicillium malachiteum]|nr:hypothetical protein N7488_009769 [Penicillium malachiteum]
MADPKEIQRDDNLMVIFLMSMYEMFTSSTRDRSYLAHMHGTQAIIAHRDGATLQDGNNHLALLCTHMIVWYLTDLKPPPVHLAGWVQQISFDSEMKKQLTGLLSTAAVICTERSLLNHSNRPDWAKKLLNIPGAPDHMRTYSNPVAASDWNMCRATRIRLWIQILNFVSRCSPKNTDVLELKERGFNLLVSLADEIAETIPYSIKLSADGSADPKSPQDIPGIYAYCILWSTYTSFLSYQSATMKERAYTHRFLWFGAMLRFLRDTTGIAKVEVFLKEQSKVS